MGVTGSSIRGITKLLERAASTVSREVARHAGRPNYRAKEADDQVGEPALRPKTCLLAIHEKLHVACSIPLVPQGAYQARALQTIIETLGAWGHFAVYNRAPTRGVADI